MGGSFCSGYDRQELIAIMDIFDVKKSIRIDVLNKVSVLESVTVNKINAR
jgi:hypothetical protein